MVIGQEVRCGNRYGDPRAGVDAITTKFDLRRRDAWKIEQRRIESTDLEHEAIELRQSIERVAAKRA
jgi:hypothetical protein